MFGTRLKVLPENCVRLAVNNRCTETVKNCGSCKWLDVAPSHLKKDFTVKERYRFRVFDCALPFTMPTVPACMQRTATERQMMAPYYGDGCAFHERRTTA